MAGFLQFSEADLLGWLAAWFYPLCRIAAVIGTAPVLSDANFPQRAKIGLAVLVTIVVAPALAGSVPTTPILSSDGLVLIVRQVVIGASMGFGMRLAMFAIQFAGDLCGLQMGLGFAQSFDPQHGQPSAVVGNLFGYLAALLFLSINGHLMVIAAVTESFSSLPIASAHPLALDWQALALAGGSVFRLGLYLSLPVVSTLLLTTVILGVMTRSAPQMNLFAIGFTFLLLVGLAALFLSMPVLLPMMQRVLEEGLAPIVS